MDMQHKIFGITPTEPLQILRISIEQSLAEEKAKVAQSFIKVAQLQATSSTIETTAGPEVTTRIDYLTFNGIFHNNELSGISIPETEDDIWSIQLNFISEANGATASLIIPTKRHPDSQMRNNYYLQKIIDYLTEDRYPLQLTKDQIIVTLIELFSEMMGKEVLLSQEGGK